jgi:acetoin utilization protein AcuB
MKSIPTLAITMTPFPYSIDVNDTLKAAINMMEKQGFHHLPVTEQGKLVGVLSDRDIKFVESPFSSASLEDELYVKDIYSSRTYVVDIHTPLENVLKVMAEKHLGSALITKNDKLAGILTHNDVFRKFADVMTKLKAKPDGNDAA